jgi:hypothetical protein
MACACNKGRLRNAAPSGATYVYQYTSADGSETTTFLSPLEAKRAVRRAGGGTIRRVESAA